ncbi:MAG: DUF2283 domain-containing protein [Ignavibacteriae bacterium]|nr:DUF2283 domain-containing protein [Ignavibacteriota bacterium]
MKIKYDREDDILIVEIGKGKIDFAEESGPLIVHFTKQKKPVLLEIMNASKFLASLTESAMVGKSGRVLEVEF